MMHGPYGADNPSCPCTVDFKCTKKFPKQFNETTVIDDKGYAIYKRRNDGNTITKSGTDLHNGYVAPYNTGLLRRYQSHINVEWCNQMGSIKYLFKYINKGPDRVTAVVDGEKVDEIKDFYDCIYLSACEAAWRIYGFDIHYRTPPVEWLLFHLQDEQSVIFDATESIDYTLEKSSVNETKFVQWMELNKTDDFASTLLYTEIPKYYVWNTQKRIWDPRQRGFSLGRIHHVPPSWGELFYLRVLLNKVKGPKEWSELKTYDNVVYPTYRDACYARELLQDDKEYIDDSMSRSEFVWEKTWHVMAADVENVERIKQNKPDIQRKNICLTYIEDMLLCNNKTLKNILNMPYPNNENTMKGYNRLIYDETSYKKDELKKQHQTMYGSLTSEQKGIYSTVMDAIDKNTGGMFFVYGYGGTGKTYLYKTMSAALRAQGDIVLNVASSGIVALLLEDGRTTHSRFAIPINILEDSMCHILADSDIADLIRQAKLIIWDEAPMIQSYCYKAFDRTLRDICRRINIVFLDEMLIPESDDYVGSIIDQTYPQLVQNLWNPTFFQERAILAPTHEIVDMINEHMMGLIPGEETLYESSDSVSLSDDDTNFDESIYTTNFLNGIKMSGLPKHAIKLKICTPESFKVNFRGKVHWVRAIEVPGWIPEFNDEEEEDDVSDECNFDGKPEAQEENNIFEESEEEKVQETEFGVPSGEKVNKSEDPFGIYSLLQKNKTNMENKVNEEDHSLSHPPGFTPEVDQFEGNAMGDIAEKVYTEKENDVNSFVNKDIGNNDSNSVNNNVEPTDLDRSKLLRSGGSILNFMEEVVKVGQTMGYNMEGCIKDINDIIESQGEFGETKMGTMDLNTVRSCWGNSIFEYVQSDSVGYSGGILCIWDPNSFRRNSFTRSDYFVIIRGVWLKSGIDLLIVVVYAPQDAKEKHMLWEYLTHISNSWDGKIVMMGDFNEVRFKSDRFGSNFNVHEAEKFNSFIYNAGMEEVSLGGSAFTWCHRSASKMSKLDRFFVSENLLTSCPNISAITLERFISDHRPILLRETSFDYGPIPFRFYKYWLEVDGFDKMVRESWEAAPGNKDNAIRSFMGKLKFLKDRIRVWLSIHKANSRSDTDILKEELRLCDELIDKGMGSSEVVQNRLEILNKIHQVQKNQASEISQKAKIKWAIEGDENVKFFHGILNKKRSQSQIRGVMANGVWIDDPVKVKDEFLMHFRSRFDKPLLNRALLDLNFTNSLTNEQKEDLEQDITKEEVKRAVWDCGVDKSPGPDGFSFYFYRHFWSMIEDDVFGAVEYFFINGDIPNGCNSNFIALIPKIIDANMVKDFRPISLIGSLYKIIAKLLANRLVGVLSNLINEVQSAFVADRQILDGPFILNEVLQWCRKKRKHALIFKVDFEKAYDSVRWDFLDDVLDKFGFGVKWRNWIQSCLRSSRGSILINGSPTKEFQFFRGLKQGDPLSPFLFILVMESLHISFQRVVDAGLFNGINLSSTVNLSHLFYADDAIFIGQWNELNIDTLVRVLECFFRASGLRINMSKSKIMGVNVEDAKVKIAANKLGCLVLKTPFTYLGTKVGENMHRKHAWNEVVEKVLSRLSRWKLKTLSIGGRFTLLKSVLGSMPIFHMSIFKVPSSILNSLEVIRSRFFNGHEHKSNKATWFKWNKVLTSKEKGGLGVSSLFALNRGLLFKWLWRFYSQKDSLWTKVIKALYGEDGSLDKVGASAARTCWTTIVQEVKVIQAQGINIHDFIKLKLGNGEDSRFWLDKWYEGGVLKRLFPRVYALELDKNISVSSKLKAPSLVTTFRRNARSGIEQTQFDSMAEIMKTISLVPRVDRYIWSLENDGSFSVASIRKTLDDNRFQEESLSTRWVKSVPIKVNILAWKVKSNALPTRFNISRRGMDIDSIDCPICKMGVETTSHVFFQCNVVRQVMRKISSWWNVEYMEVNSYEEWRSWLVSTRIRSNIKVIIEGSLALFIGLNIDVKHRSNGTIGLKTLILFVVDLAPC
ncbi:RNA-directed DNA polymerase, eukaryota [Tanacetum coccineum]|uniref:ATP-dependent DNA helicase n=1 Tax=Tanacetum coccineum TaxID=301880 RepID=A0ABQ5HL72_9ASTR